MCCSIFFLTNLNKLGIKLLITCVVEVGKRMEETVDLNKNVTTRDFCKLEVLLQNESVQLLRLFMSLEGINPQNFRAMICLSKLAKITDVYINQILAWGSFS